MKKIDTFEEEKISLKKFFNNNEVNCENFIFLKGEEPCDIYCEDTKQQFQITWNEHDFQAKIHTTPSGTMITQSRTIEEGLNDFIYQPILKKIIAYGKSAQGIILLVVSPKNFPFGNKEIEQAKNKILNTGIRNSSEDLYVFIDGLPIFFRKFA